MKTVKTVLALAFATVPLAGCYVAPLPPPRPVAYYRPAPPPPRPVVVYAPPPRPVVVYAPPPGPVWIPGHYGPNGGWIPGHYRG